MCAYKTAFHQTVLFIGSVAAISISVFLSFSSLDKQARGTTWVAGCAGDGGFRGRKETALPGSARGVPAPVEKYPKNSKERRENSCFGEQILGIFVRSG